MLSWWQKLRDWGGASSLRSSGSLTQTQFHKHLQDSLLTVKHSLFSSSVLLLCVHTRFNRFAHSSCTSLFILLFILAHPCSYYYLLSPSILFSTSYLFCKSYLFCTFYSIAHFTLYFSSFFSFTYIYIYALVLCYFYYIVIFLHCPLSGPVLIYISLLIIPCII